MEGVPWRRHPSLRATPWRTKAVAVLAAVVAVLAVAVTAVAVEASTVVVVVTAVMEEELLPSGTRGRPLHGTEAAPPYLRRRIRNSSATAWATATAAVAEPDAHLARAE